MRTKHSTGNEWENRYGYSRAVRSGDLVFLTGTISMNDDGTPHVPDDGYAQATRCFEIIERAVRALGGTRSDIVRSRVYVTDISRSDEFGRAHKDFFGEGGLDHRPCLTMVEVSGLIAPEFLVEIECDAVVGSA
ncbi:MAG: RidA family protein [Phycisphaerales bacterium]|nr:RidA family protein [Phycisphaerales bacterium]